MFVKRSKSTLGIRWRKNESFYHRRCDRNNLNEKTGIQLYDWYFGNNTVKYTQSKVGWLVTGPMLALIIRVFVVIISVLLVLFNANSDLCSKYPKFWICVASNPKSKKAEEFLHSTLKQLSSERLVYLNVKSCFRLAFP